MKRMRFIRVSPCIRWSWGGTPVLKGTRIPGGVIVGHLAAGDTIETVTEEYRITDAQVRAALNFARRLND